MIHLPYSSDHVNLMFRKLLSTEIGIYCRSFFLSFENMMRTVLQNLCYALFTRKCDAILLCMIYVIEQIIFCNLCPFACRNLMVNRPLIICGGWCPVFSILMVLLPEPHFPRTEREIMSVNISVISVMITTTTTLQMFWGMLSVEPPRTQLVIMSWQCFVSWECRI